MGKIVVKNSLFQFPSLFITQLAKHGNTVNRDTHKKDISNGGI